MGPVNRLTTAQILFLALATAEDTKIKGLSGPVERGEFASEMGMDADADIEYSRNYGRMKREMREGGEIWKELEEKKKEQAPLRQGLENAIRRTVEEEARYS